MTFLAAAAAASPIAAAGVGLSAFSGLMQMQMASAQASMMQQQGFMQAQLASLQAQREINELNAESKSLELQARLFDVESQFAELSGRGEEIAAKQRTNSAMRDTLQEISAINASSAAGMVDLGAAPTIAALDIGLGDIFSAQATEELARTRTAIAKSQATTQADFLRMQSAGLADQANFVKTVAPFQQQAALSGAFAQAGITRRSGQIGALSTIGGGLFQLGRVGGVGLG